MYYDNIRCRGRIDVVIGTLVGHSFIYFHRRHNARDYVAFIHITKLTVNAFEIEFSFTIFDSRFVAPPPQYSGTVRPTAIPKTPMED